MSHPCTKLLISVVLVACCFLKILVTMPSLAYNVRQLNDLDLEFRNIISHYRLCCSSTVSYKHANGRALNKTQVLDVTVYWDGMF